MPECDAIAQVYFSNVKTLPVGAYLWASSVGFLEVLSFNHQTGQATLRNNCESANVAVGTAIPACTCFMVGVAPIGFDVSSVEDSETSPSALGGISTAGQSVTTSSISLSFINTTVRVMNVIIDAIINVGFINSASPSEVTLTLTRQVNGGGYSTVAQRITTFVASGLFAEQVAFSYVTTVAAGATLLVEFKGKAENSGSNTILTVSGMTVGGNGLGVAL